MAYLYLLATFLFVFGIKKLTSVKTCRQGNRISEIAMLLAIVATLLIFSNLNIGLILAGVVVGGAIGALIAKKTPTTQMPEMVAALNGFGGLSSALVAIAFLLIDETLKDPAKTLWDTGAVNAISTPATIVIGMVTLTGSFVAYFKLSGKKLVHPLAGSNRHLAHAALGLAAVALGYWQIVSGSHAQMSVATALLALLAAGLGALLVLPIGGADMPVVVSLLNSYSGVAGAAAGFVINSPLLVVVGALVGTSGLILTQIMCKAMNRSLGNVLLGGMGEETVAKDAKDYKSIKSAQPEEIAMLLDGATSVVFVPGYGLAVAQAQHVVRELADLLQKRGAMVRYAIHPVAGRMPGHMNVLLAESDVPYEQLWEMERINGDFKNTDVVIVVGANDVVNPAAREASGPIAGMPILDVDQARTVVVVKRSLAPGYAGIKNPLFEAENTLMVFLDAKEALEGIVKEVKELK
ncbi:MAG: NAD(P)(+) transhydrogenase (Re/Si-specific) subunit beta [Planctomycetota bacterium]